MEPTDIEHRIIGDLLNLAAALQHRLPKFENLGNIQHKILANVRAHCANEIAR
jgi:hypothetical protein